MVYHVTVEKRMYCTAEVTIDCDSPEQAQELVENQITSGALQTTDLLWGDPQYEDCSFITTGDVD